MRTMSCCARHTRLRERLDSEIAHSELIRKRAHRAEISRNKAIEKIKSLEKIIETQGKALMKLEARWRLRNNNLQNTPEVT